MFTVMLLRARNPADELDSSLYLMRSCVASCSCCVRYTQGKSKWRLVATEFMIMVRQSVIHAHSYAQQRVVAERHLTP